MNKRSGSKKKLKAVLGLTVIVIVIVTILAFLLRDQLAAFGVESTDLSSLTINGIAVNENIADVQWDVYKKNPSFVDKSTEAAEYRYYEDFLVVYESDGAIIKLKTLSEHGIMSQAGDELTELNEVESKLGDQYTVRSYDSAQGLKARVYYDKENRIKASFVYPKNAPDDKIVWSIVERY
ncbi:peptidase M56 [Paenibacillus sp. FSL L8-0463]|uniref:peptidase M56 n=1 Tax=Paenibacillus sp. FSL L8-0463 TaxID=2954687 RepID=UPI00311A64C8